MNRSMNLIIWITVGLVAGFLHGRICTTNQFSHAKYLIASSVGAVFGGVIYSLLTLGVIFYSGTVISIPGLLFSILGAIGGLVIQKQLNRPLSAAPTNLQAKSHTESGQQIIPTQVLIEQSIQIAETTRSEESLGEEQRIIDNLNSSIQVSRRFTVSKGWSQSYAIGYENVSTNKGEIGFNILNQANLKYAIEEALKEQYSISEQSSRTCAEEVLLEVPARTKLCVSFQWKRIWQHGVIKLPSQKGQIIEVPFQVVVGLTFDQVQTDKTD